MLKKLTNLMFCFSAVVSLAQHVKHVEATKDERRVSIDVPFEQQQRIGLQTTTVQQKDVTHTVRTVGTVAASQKNEAHVHTKISGHIETIYADYVGQDIKKGDPLFGLYGPELLSTQEEYIAASKQKGVGKELARAALDRLRLWGVSTKEIEKLKKTKKASRVLIFDSPVSGNIISKNAILGMYITPGMELYQIADLSQVWIIVNLYEYDMEIIKAGDMAEVQLPYDERSSFTGRISYIAPDIDLDTRTAKARIEVDNKKHNLRPGTYVNVIVKKDLGQSLVIPDDSVIDTGRRKIVFVKSGSSRFEPREVKTGARVANQFTVLDGVRAGELVVSSAHFFIDAESKLRAATDGRSPAETGHGAHGGK